MVTGLLIGLREGVEASLVIGIVVAYLVRTGNGRHLPKIWAGTVAAIAASILLGLALWVVAGELPPPYEQAFEAGTMIFATAVVTWMLFWMRRQARSIRHDLESRLAAAITEGGAWGLAILAFMSVVREGIETALFMFGQVTAAQGASGDGLAVLVGAVVGLVIAVGIGWGIYRGSRLVNLRSFFLWTGIALVFVAAGLVSRAIHELVEIGVVGVGTQTAYDVSRILPDESGIGQFLRAIFGYASAPEVATLAVYLVYAAAVLVLYLAPSRPPARPRPVEA